jgi:hypothetical protein
MVELVAVELQRLAIDLLAVSFNTIRVPSIPGINSPTSRPPPSFFISTCDVP